MLALWVRWGICTHRSKGAQVRKMFSPRLFFFLSRVCSLHIFLLGITFPKPFPSIELSQSRSSSPPKRLQSTAWDPHRKSLPSQSTFSTKEPQLVECDFMTAQSNSLITYHSITRLVPSKSRILEGFKLWIPSRFMHGQVVAHNSQARRGCCKEPCMGQDGKTRPIPVLETAGRWQLLRTSGPAT